METIWITGILLFIVITFSVRKLFNGFYKKETSKAMRNTWGARMYYWHFVLMASGLATVVILSFFN